MRRRHDLNHPVTHREVRARYALAPCSRAGLASPDRERKRQDANRFESVLSSHEQQTSRHSDTRQGEGNTSSDPEYRHVPKRPSLTYYIGFQLLALKFNVHQGVSCTKEFRSIFYTVLLFL